MTLGYSAVIGSLCHMLEYRAVIGPQAMGQWIQWCDWILMSHARIKGCDWPTSCRAVKTVLRLDPHVTC